MSDAPQPAIEEEITGDDWRAGFELLAALLEREGGCVSSLSLKRELQRRGMASDVARAVLVRLRFYDPESENDSKLPTPGFLWHHKGRSFYSEAAFGEAERQTDAAAEAAGEAEPVEPGVEEEIEEIELPRRNKREEARLCSYVLDQLESLYASDVAPEDRPVAFDVHSDRAGTAFENVDLIAVHWRSQETVELIAVEVKLKFGPFAVQQANNYRRFAHRVWLAVAVSSTVDEAGLELRESAPRLFEYVTSLGIGILGCRRGVGRSYTVFPIQWPRLSMPDPIERAEFIERHRSVFEEAGVVEPQARHYPRIQ